MKSVIFIYFPATSNITREKVETLTASVTEDVKEDFVTFFISDDARKKVETEVHFNPYQAAKPRIKK